MDLNIAGVVGVGKSSLTKLLEDDGYQIFKEPVFDNPLLDKFYYDKQRYAFILQIFFLNKRFEMCKEANKIRDSVMDRSIVEDTIFAKMLRDSGDMSPYEYQVYKELFDNMIEHVTPPKLMVYLRISPEEALRRIRKRGRQFEVDNDKKYWYDLNQNYDNFFHEYKWSELLIIDVDNLDFVNNKKDEEVIKHKIYDRLYKHLQFGGINGFFNDYGYFQFTRISMLWSLERRTKKEQVTLEKIKDI